MADIPESAARGVGLRLVWRVAAMQFRPWPGLIVRECSRCSQPVYVDTGQAVPPEMADAALVCVPCGLADPDLRPWIESVHRDVRAAAVWAGARDVSRERNDGN